MNFTPQAFEQQFSLSAIGVMGVVSLIAATTNAFNGALLARRPDHYKHFTVIGVIILAYVGGIGGGILRDILVNRVPSPLINPWYIILCLGAAVVALVCDYYATMRFKDGLFQFMTAFTLPWYAIVGAQAAVDAKLGYLAAILIGVIATTGGRYFIDISCGCVPKQLVRGEYFVMTAAATAALYLVCNGIFGLSQITATAIAFFFGFGFRLLSQTLGLEEWEPWEPPELKTGEKTRKTLGQGLYAEFHSDPGSDKT
jgi:uncharacterized membrane protein YeiH